MFEEALERYDISDNEELEVRFSKRGALGIDLKIFKSVSDILSKESFTKHHQKVFRIDYAINKNNKNDEIRVIFDKNSKGNAPIFEKKTIIEKNEMNDYNLKIVKSSEVKINLPYKDYEKNYIVNYRREKFLHSFTHHKEQWRVDLSSVYIYNTERWTFEL